MTDALDDLAQRIAKALRARFGILEPPIVDAIAAELAPLVAERDAARAECERLRAKLAFCREVCNSTEDEMDSEYTRAENLRAEMRELEKVNKALTKGAAKLLTEMEGQ